MHECAGAGGGADGIAVHRNDTALEVYLVEDFGAAGHGLVQFREGLCLGKTGKVAGVFNDQMGHVGPWDGREGRPFRRRAE